MIDIQATVVDLEDPRLAEGVEAAGFRMRPDIVCDHVPPWSEPVEHDRGKRFADAGSATRRAHVHLREDGRPNQRYALLFRDYLREHEPAAAAYERAKRSLAEAFSSDSGAYAAAKDPVCDLIVIAAEEWARRTGWFPGRSDA